jgi:Helix-turn-helix domain
MRRNADLLLHPVRLRIIQALAGRRRLTSRELGAELDDVPQASLYRHVAILSEAGVVATVDQVAARGTPRRVLALVDGAASLSGADVATATPDDHLRWFTIFAAGLIDDFGGYVAAGPVDFERDGAGYRQLPLELSDREFAELVGRINAALAPVVGNEPSPERRRRTLTTIVVPARPNVPKEGSR